ncbi:PQQ-binding-like beta-propeller repeat protein [Acidobacteriota bacterium]
MKFKKGIQLFVLIVLAVLVFGQCSTPSKTNEGWTTFRYDNSRSSYTLEAVSPPLELLWQFQPSQAPKPAWPEPGEEMRRIQMDNAFHTVAANGLVFFGSSADHKVYALDLNTGKERWHFYTEGPVRYAPTIWNNQIYVGSDDGYVYCLNLKSGKVIWKYRAGPSGEKVLGNGHLISLWPVRTGILVDEGTVYFAAGVFPYEGIYICALNAGDGSVIWKNDTIGDHEHELIFGGIAPQSYLVASEDILYVPSSRAMPAAFDKHTGEFLYYLEPGGKIGGAWALLDQGRLIAGVDQSGTPAKAAYDPLSGQKKQDMHAWFPGIDIVVSEDTAFTLGKDGVYALDRKQYSDLQKNQLEVLAQKRSDLRAKLRDISTRLTGASSRDAERLRREQEDINLMISELGEVEKKLKPEMFQWKYEMENLNTILRAGEFLYAGGETHVIGLNTESGQLVWDQEIEGNAVGLSALKDHLLVSTDRGKTYCFAPRNTAEAAVISQNIDLSEFKGEKVSNKIGESVTEILARTGIDKGYALVISGNPGQVAYEIAKNSELKTVVLVDGQQNADTVRADIFPTGLYGSQIVVHPTDISSLPAYFANLILVDNEFATSASSAPDEIYRVLKPYGGTAVIGELKRGADENQQEYVMEWLKGSIPDNEIQSLENSPWITVTRGALAGAGVWTEEYGNPGNTACSGDELVNGSLSVLWFGEPGSKKMLDRHSKAQSPLSMDGRMFLEGEEVVMAYDAYNGTLLWEKDLTGAVRPRADVDGGNFSLNSQGLFVGAGEVCYRLDPKTGETLGEFELPGTPSSDKFRWAHASATETTLFGSRARTLPKEYFEIRDTLIDGYEWKDLKEIPEEYQDLYLSMKKTYPDPQDGLLEDFKRSGILWRSMVNYPDWENYYLQDGALTDRLLTSDMVFAYDPESQDLKWKHQGSRIAHISISKGSGNIFFAESRVSAGVREQALRTMGQLKSQGVYIEHQEQRITKGGRDIRTVIALDAESGRKVWEKALDFSGCGGDTLASACHNGVLVFFSNMGSHDWWRHENGDLRWKRLIALSAETGEVLWSHANNYRTRPVIVGDKIYIEPRVCDLHTGEILNRTHPVSGLDVPYEYLRPGHTCAITSASASTLFYRSACAAVTDFEKDDGLALFGGIRPGCWINMIPASGVLLFPEASAGCTCSYPLRGSVVLMSKPDRWPKSKVFIAHGPMTPVKHFSINLGAAGDMKDDSGNVWLAYPNPDTNYTNNHYPDYGIKFDLNEKILRGMGYFNSDHRNLEIQGTDKPWLYTSGAAGITSFEIPLIDDIWGEEPGVYSIRLGFKAPADDRRGQRIFSIKIQGETVASDFDIRGDADILGDVVLKEFSGVPVENLLRIELVPAAQNPELDQAPLINFIQVEREDFPSPEKSAEVMSTRVAQDQLRKAQILLADDQTETALEVFHSVLDVSQDKQSKIRALRGMTRIASPASLEKIADYCRNVAPIIRDYKDQDQDLRKEATNVFLAIADRILETNRKMAIRMLDRAMKFTPPEDLDTLTAITTRAKEWQR